MAKTYHIQLTDEQKRQLRYALPHYSNGAFSTVMIAKVWQNGAVDCRPITEDDILEIAQKIIAKNRKEAKEGMHNERNNQSKTQEQDCSQIARRAK